MKKGVDFTGLTVTFACHDGDGNYLFAKRSENSRDEKNVWDVGGGGLEFGDTVEETLRKEIREEYCTDVIDFEFLGYRDVHRENEGVKTHWVALDFKVLVDREKAKIGEPHKLSELRWLKITEAPSPLHSQLPKYFELYKDKL